MVAAALRAHLWCLAVAAATYDSCQARCGQPHDPRSPCQCDSQCVEHANCCDDYDVLCKGPVINDDVAATEKAIRSGDCPIPNCETCEDFNPNRCKLCEDTYYHRNNGRCGPGCRPSGLGCTTCQNTAEICTSCGGLYVLNTATHTCEAPATTTSPSSPTTAPGPPGPPTPGPPSPPPAPTPSDWPLDCPKPEEGFIPGNESLQKASAVAVNVTEDCCTLCTERKKCKHFSFGTDGENELICYLYADAIENERELAHWKRVAAASCIAKSLVNCGHITRKDEPLPGVAPANVKYVCAAVAAVSFLGLCFMGFIGGSSERSRDRWQKTTKRDLDQPITISNTEMRPRIETPGLSASGD